MSAERTKRKLSGILSADAVGYSRLMQDDEAATILTLADSKELMANLIQEHHGRVVDAPGDNLLAEFGSVVDATECAVKIQEELKIRNADLSDSRKMPFRIGINLGDVVEETDRIYGDGVNIAARLEGLAEPGGICISRTAYDHVKNKLDLGYEYLGEHSVKNIAEPVRVYKVLMEPEAAGKVIGEKRFLGRFSRRTAMAAIIILAVVAGGVIGWNIYLQQSKKVEPASLDKMAYSLPDLPSIAVLPFTNMSDDPKQEYLSDGITEQIITSLSKVRGLFVISRTSTFTYKGKPVKVQQVSQDLGVRYVLEGSVQRSGDHVRVITQLIDAIDGKHLWAERYDRDLKDIFELQDELTSKIVHSLRVKLTEGEEAKLWEKNRPSSIQFNEKLFEAQFYFSQYNKEANMRAKQLYKEAINLEPVYFGAYAGLAWGHLMDVWLGSSSSPRESLSEAFKLCKKAMALDPSQDMPHGILGHIYALSGKLDKAIAEGELAVALNPNSAGAYVWLGTSLNYAGRPDEAINSFKKALRLNPNAGAGLMNSLGNAYREAGRYEEAVIEYKKCLNLTSDNIFAQKGLVITYVSAGRYEETRQAWSDLLKLEPKMSIEKLFKVWPYGPENRERKIAAMHKAGIK